MSTVRRQIAGSLRQALGAMPAVALLGPRQVGKTTLAKQLARSLSAEPLLAHPIDPAGALSDSASESARVNEALYLDLESPDDLLKLNDPVGFLRDHRDKLVIIDEIQRAPDLFKVLRGLIDANIDATHNIGSIPRRNAQFLLLGSASMELMRQSSESLAGRIRYLELTGFHQLEIQSHTADAAVDQPSPSFDSRLWLRGGFPAAYLAPDDAMAMDWLEDLIRTYLERDIPQLGFRIPATRLRRLWTMLAHLQGSVINVSKLASNLDVSAKTVQHHLDLLVDLMLIRRLNPWHSNIKKRLVKSSHYYIRDSGLLHRLLGIDDHQALLSHPVLGKSFEGFVVENVLSVLPRRAKAFFYGTAAGGEIDLVLELSATETWAIEIKYGRAPKIPKHFRRLADDLGASERIIVYGGNDCFPIKGGGQVMGLSALMQALSERASAGKTSAPSSSIP